jgi:polyisoprenoid-binding protein YceI
VRFDPEHPEQSPQIRITVGLASASVGDATQDQMLTGDDFLASGAQATATYRSDSIRSLGKDRYQAEGTLSLKGASRPQSLTFTLSGSGLERHVQGRDLQRRRAKSGRIRH